MTTVSTSPLNRRTDWLILVLAAGLRLYALDLKPMHHDEGINGSFLINLLRQGVYTYDPANYHGPTLYYLTVPIVVLFGLSTFAVRLLTALAGIATVWLVLGLRRYIGDLGALAAGLLIAVSPGAVFYSRYFIHETLFVFFTVATVAAALRFHETGKAKYVMLVAASAAMLFATKETAFITAGTLCSALLIANVWARGRSWADGHEADPTRVLLLAWGSVALFLSISIVFYSSFFTNWRGLGDAFRALTLWPDTGTGEHYARPLITYLNWIAQEEAPALILAFAGALVALFRKPVNRFTVFAGAWAFGMFLAYSLIPYKTPWLMLNFIVPMGIVAGYAVQALLTRGRGIPVAAAGLAAAVGLYQSVVLNFREYDNDRYPYVYSQTSRETMDLLAAIDRMAHRAGTPQIPVTIASPEHWPLPWYFRDNPRVGYTGTVSERYEPNSAPVVIGRQSTDPGLDQVERLRSVLGSGYREVGVYKLRPGVNLTLFARRDLTEP